MTQPYELTACDALEQIRRRALSIGELVESCLARIDALDESIGAWTWLDPDMARARARALETVAPAGMLHGIPIGIKDVIDTADMPTEYGTPIFAGWRPRSDAGCVTTVRKEGGVILGKTVTQAFACGAPVRTANPLDLDRTSGGSSSGSVAAVAAKMVPVAIGTQSASSLIRPASYTGLVGMRPSMGLISVAGFKYFNGSFDTIGLLARCVDDVELLWASQLGVPFARGQRPKTMPRIAICRPPWLVKAEPSARAAIDKAERAFAAAGAPVRELTLPTEFAVLCEVHERMQEFEAARSYAWEYEHHRDYLDSSVRGIIERGLAFSFDAYLELVLKAQRARARLAEVMGDAECIVTAAAPGEAPLGFRALGEEFKSMGDTTQSRAWTLLHLPVVTVPCHRGPAGMPVGIQLIGRFGADLALLHIARWAEDVLGATSEAIS
jgi:amidase